MTRRSTEGDFWARIDRHGEDECWPFVGHTCPQGYGKLMFQGKPWLAHRLAYTLAVGEIPEGMCVCHTCDNPTCCNPAHFFVGDRDANNKDRNRKGRSSGGRHMGEANPAAKITRRQAEEIRRLRKDGLTYAQIADRYPIRLETVGNIIKGRIWRSQSANNRRGNI